MSLPGDIATIVVTGTFLGFAGTPCTGCVTFDPGGVVLADATGHAILVAPVTATLNGSGHISVTLPCTDAVTLSPGPFTYTVTTALDGLPGSSHPRKAIPHTLGASVDLSSLLP